MQRSCKLRTWQSLNLGVSCFIQKDSLPAVPHLRGPWVHIWFSIPEKNVLKNLWKHYCFIHLKTYVKEGTILWTRKANCCTNFGHRNLRRNCIQNCEYWPRKWVLTVIIYIHSFLRSFHRQSLKEIKKMPSLWLAGVRPIREADERIPASDWLLLSVYFYRCTIKLRIVLTNERRRWRKNPSIWLADALLLSAHFYRCTIKLRIVLTNERSRWKIPRIWLADVLLLLALASIDGKPTNGKDFIPLQQLLLTF